MSFRKHSSITIVFCLNCISLYNKVSFKFLRCQFKPIRSMPLFQDLISEIPQGDEFEHPVAPFLLHQCIWSIVCFTAESTWRAHLWWCMIVIFEASTLCETQSLIDLPLHWGNWHWQDDHFSSPTVYTGNFHVVNRGIDSGLWAVFPGLSLSSGEKTISVDGLSQANNVLML